MTVFMNADQAALNATFEFTKTFAQYNALTTEEAATVFAETTAALRELNDRLVSKLRAGAAALSQADGETHTLVTAPEPAFVDLEKLRANLPANPHRFRNIKRGKGRPSLEEKQQERTLEPDQKAFYDAFRAAYPPLMPEADTIASESLTIIFDGHKARQIKRYLDVKYDLDFEDYKLIYGLSEDYPSSCEECLETRSKIAINQGFGDIRKNKGTGETPVETPAQNHEVVAETKRRGRPRKLAA